MKRMLINAVHRNEEVRIALASGQQLYDLIIESSAREQKQSNIYKGKVTRIEPSLEAAFVDYGEGRHGFLPLKEVARSCFKSSYVDSGRRPSIVEVLDEGQELVVQVEKEERGNKGAALTTFVSLPGCYLVLMPNNPRAGGISRRIDGDERGQLHEIFDALQVPEGMGLIVRTAGSGKSQEELQWDLEILLKHWDAIKQASERTAPFLIYQESNAIIRAIRDYLRKDIEEILIDQPEVYEEALNHLKLIRPTFVNKVKLYKDATPLFTRFQIESQIESAFQREVRLPSGGAIIIDHTEAMVSIDINSAKSTKGSDIEETALMTNLESADEIARQLRLRDIGGLIVIDFIDMTPIRNQREVEDRLRNALSMDRARVQIGRISRFGLLEMSRQRLRPSLGESSRITCPRCMGQGTIRGIESLSLSIIRLIEEEALKDNTAQVRAILPIDIAAYLLNEKRQSILEIEKRQNVSVVLVPNPHLLTPQYQVERIRLSDWTEQDEKIASYKLAVKPEAEAPAAAQIQQRPHQEAAIKSMPIEQSIPAPTPTQDKNPNGVLKRLFKFLFQKEETAVEEQDGSRNRRFRDRPPQHRRGGRQHHHNRDRGGDRSSRGRRPHHHSQQNSEHRQSEHSNFEHRHTEHRHPHHHGEHSTPTVEQNPQNLSELTAVPTSAHREPTYHEDRNIQEMPRQIGENSPVEHQQETLSREERPIGEAPAQESNAAAPAAREERKRPFKHSRRYRHGKRSTGPRSGNTRNTAETASPKEGEDIYNGNKSSNEE